MTGSSGGTPRPADEVDMPAVESATMGTVLLQQRTAVAKAGALDNKTAGEVAETNADETGSEMEEGDEFWGRRRRSSRRRRRSWSRRRSSSRRRRSSSRRRRRSLSWTRRRRSSSSRRRSGFGGFRRRSHFTTRRRRGSATSSRRRGIRPPVWQTHYQNWKKSRAANR